MMRGLAEGGSIILGVGNSIRGDRGLRSAHNTETRGGEVRSAIAVLVRGEGVLFVLVCK